MDRVRRATVNLSQYWGEGSATGGGMGRRDVSNAMLKRLI